MITLNIHDIRPGESLAGFAIRESLRRGGDPRPLVSALTTRSKPSPDRDVRFRLRPNLIKNALIVVPTDRLRGVVRDHTLVPAYVPTRGYRAIDGTVRALDASRGSFEIDRSPNSIEARFCPACFVDQIETFGHAFYKREWLIPYSISCTTHKRRLVSVVCDSCKGKEYTYGALARPLERLCRYCGSDQWVHSDAPCTSTIDAWFVDMLYNPLPYMSDELRKLSFLEAARRLGVNGEDQAALFEFDSRWAARISTQPNGFTILRSMSVRAVSNNAPSRRSVGHLCTLNMLAFWLPMIAGFESFREFTEWLESVSNSASPNDAAQRRILRVDTSVSEQTRRSATVFCRARP